ncbi:sensor histidine kinase [Modestobacter lapidis]|nr:sensor histidine kinase [Modestobacter lapidis]
MDQPLPERLAARLRRHPFAVDVAIAAALVLVALLFQDGTLDGDTPLVILLLLAPLAWRRRAPVPAAGVVVAVGLLQLVIVDDFLFADVAALVMVHALAAYAPRWAGRAGLGAGLVGAVLASAQYFSAGDVYTFAANAGAIGVTVVAAWALGDLRRARLQQLAGLQERARLLELEREQEMRLAATAERARIAREMHDVVAHSLSVVIAQADGGRYAGRSDPAAAAGALEAIAATGRQALTDMRSLLGVLRDGGGEEYAPQPDVAAIDQLVADVRASGLDVDLIVEGTPQPLPAGPQLAAYRIVQESLTNVLKHAGPASRAWVRLHWRPDGLELAVLDDGRGASAGFAERDTEVLDGASGNRPRTGHGLGDGLGQGLLGMRERAELHGGRLTAAPRTGGGFGVHALLPYRPPR